LVLQYRDAIAKIQPPSANVTVEWERTELM
jgi:hypothetical protein